MEYSFVGLKDFDKAEQEKIKLLTKESCVRLDRDMPTSTLILQIKKHAATGKRVNYSAHARVNAPSYLLEAKADDWDLAIVLHKVFNKLIHQIQHKLRTEGQPQEKKR